MSASGAESFVVGIHGKWGTGKSSVLNLIVEQIDQHNKSAKDDDKLYILRFNPWNFSDQNQLVLQFLKQFRAHLGKFQGAAKKNAQRIVDTLDDYADALAPPLELIPYGGKLLSHGAKAIFGGARKLLGTGKEIGDIFHQLVEESGQLKRRTIVLIDDIDRLNAAETRQIFQLVKLTARFPYVTYVLAFDREAVASALKATGVDSGEEYLEKIVQVSFDLPMVSEVSLTSLITQGIDSLLAKYKPAHFDMHRFGNLFHSGFRSSFTSVRHVRRFLNGLEFSLSLIGQEVNGVDIIGIEALKAFYPHAFEAVRNNKELFAGRNDKLTGDSDPSEYKAKLNEILAPAEEMNEALKDLLTELFPRIQSAYSTGRTIFGSESESKWEQEYRAASTRYFDAYFQLTLGPSEISVAEVTDLILDCGDGPKILARLQQLKQQGKLKAAMDSLRFRLTEVTPKDLPVLLSALIRTGEIASEEGTIMAGQIPEYWHVRWVLFDVLDRIPALERPDVIRDIAERVFAPKTFVNTISMIEELRNKKSKYGEFTDESLKLIRSAVARRVKTAAANGEITGASDIIIVSLYAWRQWGNATEAASFVASVTSTDQELVKFLKNFIYKVNSASSGDKILTTTKRLAMQQLSESLDLNALHDRLKQMEMQKLNGTDRDVAAFALEQLTKMREKGVTPAQFDQSRLFLD